MVNTLIEQSVYTHMYTVNTHTHYTHIHTLHTHTYTHYTQTTHTTHTYTQSKAYRYFCHLLSDDSLF